MAALHKSETKNEKDSEIIYRYS